MSASSRSTARHHVAHASHSGPRRTIAALASAAALVALSAPAALADDVTASAADFQVISDQNTIVLTIGEAASVTLTYANTNGDGKNGCNLSGSGDTQLALDVVGTADPIDGAAGIDGLPLSVVFPACDDNDLPANQVLSFTATSPGTTSYAFPVNSSSTVAWSGSTFDTSGSNFVVTVLAPVEELGKDAPAIANGWLHNTADADQLEACRQALGNNKNKSNWQGNLISQIAQFFAGQTFTASQEATVVNKVKTLCGL